MSKEEIRDLIRDISVYLDDKNYSMLETLKGRKAVREIKELKNLKNEVAGCRKCGLHKERTQTVFGTGSDNPILVVVGEAPGRDEDIQGLPFVGRAGQLLTKMLSSIEIDRKDVFITNVLKCRPPGNRTPVPSEMQACRHYLDSQIEMLKPKLILALGNPAVHTLLNTVDGITKLRGKFHKYGEIPVMSTYHPSALLRTPDLKRQSWEDLKKLKAEYDKFL